MAITKTDVLLIAPELTAITDNQWTAIIADAYEELNESAWGTRRDKAAKYLAAHKATLFSRGGQAQVKSETVGDISVTYDTASVNEDPMKATSYGVEYTRMVRTLIGRVGVI